MTEQNHDEIARRLRETGTVPAPDRLRGDVMSQVRAEPRVRRPRRSFFAPVLPYAAAAAVLAMLVLAISHLGGGSGSMSSGAGASSGAGGGSRAPEATKGAPTHDSQGIQAKSFSVARGQALGFADEPSVTATRAPGVIVLHVPRSLYADYRRRLAKLERQTPEGPTIRVILRRVP
jgi:hypothetical protein